MKDDKLKMWSGLKTVVPYPQGIREKSPIINAGYWMPWREARANIDKKKLVNSITSDLKNYLHVNKDCA